MLADVESEFWRKVRGARNSGLARGSEQPTSRLGEMMAQVREAVREYAGIRIPPGSETPPRRFGASRFVLVTSAMIEGNPSSVDEAERLTLEYKGYLEIDAVGAEQLSRVLHDSGQ